MALSPRIRWVVRPGDGSTVGEVARMAGADEDAVHQGRVFVGRVRAGDATARLDVGDVLTIAAAGAPPFAVEVLADEDGVIAAAKPAGMPTIPDEGGSSHALLGVLAAILGCDPAKLHPTSRLDREVSGVVLFTRTPEAAERLAAARKNGAYARRYVAIACRGPDPARGVWEAPIGRAKDPRKRTVSGRDATDARSVYALVARAGSHALLALEPLTGRTHQLRVHAAHAGAPLLGDGAYGGETRVVLTNGRVLAVGRIALHAARVIVPSRSGKTLEVGAEVPRELGELWTTLGGEDDAWSEALSAGSLAAQGPR